MMITTNKMYYPEIGGVESAAKTIAEFGLQLYGQSMVITFNTNNTKTEETINGVHVIRLPVWFRRDPISYPKNMQRYCMNMIVIRPFGSFTFLMYKTNCFFTITILKDAKYAYTIAT